MDLRALAEFAYSRVLPWAAPPLLGAVIGYVTNDIAIRMLFRPLAEKRLLGLRLPFTPGVIPRQRYELAESIARMVSSELITPEAVRGQMATAGFRERLEGNVQSLLGDLLDRPLAELGGADGEALLDSLERFLADALSGFFSSRSFIHGARALITDGVHRLSGLTLEEIFAGGGPGLRPGPGSGLRPGPRLPGLGELVAERLLPLLSSPENRRRAAGAVRRWLEARRSGSPGDPHTAAGRSADGQDLAVLAELLQSIGSLGGLAVTPLLESLFGWLEQGPTRAELELRGKELLRGVLDKLNVLQKFLVTAGQFDRRLEQKMPEIVEDSLRALREYAFHPRTLDRLKGLPAEALERWSRRPAVEALAGIDPQEAADLVERALAALDGEPFRRRLAQGVERWAKGQRERSLGELARRLLGLGEQELAELASVRVLDYLSRPESSQAIAAEVIGFSQRFLSEHAGDPLRSLLKVDGQAQRRAGTWLSARLQGILESRVPALIESFDIHQLVTAKVNALDVAQVEKLLLMVIARQLKWINLFGAILGALIGLAQLLLRLLR
jgi:uncharacterized membrane protein YheB (UPF0754 family)